MLKFGDKESPVEVSSRNNNYFINTFEIIYQGNNSFFVPKLNAIIEFTNIKNDKFQDIIIQESKSKIGRRIE